MGSLKSSVLIQANRMIIGRPLNLFRVLFTLVSIFAICSFAYTGSQIYFFLLFLLLPFGLLRPQALIPAYFIASLSSDFFVASEGVGLGRMLALAIVLGVLLKVSLRRQPVLKKWFPSLILFSASITISTLNAYDSELAGLFVMGLNLIVFLSLVSLGLTHEEILELIKMILIAVLMTSLFFLFLALRGNLLVLWDRRMTISEGVNENRFGMMLAQMSAFCIAYSFISRSIIVKAACLMVGLLNIFFIFQTGSRSALIGIIGGVLIATSIYYVKILKLGQWILFLGITVILVGGNIVSIINKNPMLAGRMNIQGIIDSGGTRRWPRIVAEIKYVIPAHFLFGVGLGANNERFALDPIIGDPGSSHNLIVSTIAQIGIVGFAIVATLLLNILKKMSEKIRIYPVIIIPLMLVITASFNGIGEVMFTERIFWNALALGGVCLAAANKTERMRRILDGNWNDADNQ
jgi:O-antigen ligase